MNPFDQRDKAIELLMGDEAGCAAAVWAPGSEEELQAVDLMAKRGGVLPVQTHSTNVAVVTEPGGRPDDTDAVITRVPGLVIGVLTADCVPMVVYAPDIRAVAAIHAGWRGTLNGIIDNVVDKLAEMGADPKQMKVAFGPSISRESYEVDFDLAQKFAEAGFGDCVYYLDEKNGKPHIDLQQVNTIRFTRRGVRGDNIAKHVGCTFASVDADGKPLYFSHRRSHGAPARNLTAISLCD
ncbi:MAG: peptidoglycan editing factor PgeF [Muribaculaceae bacterium]|nr:peptidoglycan editing factor PgeF [Muribaculaceae bacterium]MDE5967518.1 peptidoglycan editing factor PgeF [Muribaculaceae bacterium]